MQYKNFSLFFEKYNIKYSYHIDKEDNQPPPANCVICIGGEFINTITKKYLDEFPGNEEYLKNVVEDGQSTIIKITPKDATLTNPKCVFIMTGCSAKDTKAATSFFSQNFEQLVKKDMLAPNLILYLRTQSNGIPIHKSTSLVR
jgi:hypothetical protein